MLVGNEAVLRARFEDAQFFYSKDRQQKLESFRPQLRTTTFQQGLGSMLDKSERVEQLVGLLGSLTSQPSGAHRAHHSAMHKVWQAGIDAGSKCFVAWTAFAGSTSVSYAHMLCV